MFGGGGGGPDAKYNFFSAVWRGLNLSRVGQETGTKQFCWPKCYRFTIIMYYLNELFIGPIGQFFYPHV